MDAVEVLRRSGQTGVGISGPAGGQSRLSNPHSLAVHDFDAVGIDVVATIFGGCGPGELDPTVVEGLCGQRGRAGHGRGFLRGAGGTAGGGGVTDGPELEVVGCAVGEPGYVYSQDIADVGPGGRVMFHRTQHGGTRN